MPRNTQAASSRRSRCQALSQASIDAQNAEWDRNWNWTGHSNNHDWSQAPADSRGNTPHPRLRAAPTGDRAQSPISIDSEGNPIPALESISSTSSGAASSPIDLTSPHRVPTPLPSRPPSPPPAPCTTPPPLPPVQGSPEPVFTNALGLQTAMFPQEGDIFDCQMTLWRGLPNSAKDEIVAKLFRQRSHDVVLIYLQEIELGIRREQEQRLKEATQCLICYKPNHRAQITPCGHTFCKECLDPWMAGFTVNFRKPTCPTCRIKFDKATELYCYADLVDIVHGPQS
jgi:hypothetical protein